jgi:ribosomal protein S14
VIDGFNIYKQEMFMRKIDPTIIISERLTDPAISMAEIGRKYDISRERVRQILVANNLPTFTKQVKPHCSRCGKPYSRIANYPKKWKVCRDCFMKLPKQTRDFIRQS